MNRRFLTHEGETLHLGAWAQRYDLNPKTLSERLAKGWTVARALTTPVQQHAKIYQAILAYEARQQEEGRA